MIKNRDCLSGRRKPDACAEKTGMVHQVSKVFTLIELLVVIAMIAILLSSKGLYFLLFSAYFVFLRFDEKTLNTQIPNVTFCMIAD